MTQKEFSLISKHLSPKVATAVKALEKELDEHFMNEKKLKPYQYKAFKKIVTGVMIKESIPHLTKRISQEYLAYTKSKFIAQEKKEKAKKQKAKKQKAK